MSLSLNGFKTSIKGAKKKAKKVTGKISVDWLFDKRVLVILSVTISVVFWFYITLNVSPNEKKTFADVPVTIDTGAIESKGLELLDIMDTQLLGDKTYTVPVEVEGNRYSLTQIDKEDISVVAQLTNVIENQPNNYTLTLKVTCTNSLYNVTARSTVESITVKLDVMTEKVYTIKTKTNSTATTENESYTMESPSTYIGNEKISEVKINGPQTVINKISRVEVFAEGAQNLTQTTDFNDGSFILYNEDNVRISGSDLDYVTVTAIEEQYENVPISSAAVTVKVPLRINATAKLTVLFDESKVGSSFNWNKLRRHITVTPSTEFGIKYPPDIDREDAANDIVNSLEQKTGRIDLSSITPENNVYSETITLPLGVELTGGFSGNQLEVKVKFDLSGYTSKTLKIEVWNKNFSYDSESTDMIITPSGTINVTFVGPKAEIAKLNEENISDKVIIVADASNVTAAGTVSLPVNVHIKGTTGCWATGTDEALSLSVTAVEPNGE